MDNKLVYHYCSVDVFKQIITNKTIRLSDITKSNDSMEILWISQFIKDIFNEEFDKECFRTKYFANEYSKELFSELVNHYTTDFFKENFRLYSYLVCCLSESGDLLSQWRGYADDATGISIGFDTELLAKIGKRPVNDPISSDLLNFNKIIYDERNQKALIRECAKILVKELKTLVKKPINNIKQESMPLFNNCFFQLFRLSVFVKNPFFKEEKEWRLCFMVDLNHNNKVSRIKLDDGLSLSDINYYSCNNNIIPYVDLSFKDSKKCIIRKIIIGPKCKASIKDIEIFMQSNGIVCEIEKSKGTYR